MNTNSDDPDSKESTTADEATTIATTDASRGNSSTGKANHDEEVVDAHREHPSDTSTTLKQISQQDEQVHYLNQETVAPPLATSFSLPKQEDATADLAATSEDGQQTTLTSKGKAVVPAIGTINVLFGRGVPIQRNHGNIRMHHIVDSYRQRYRVANRADKTVLVRAVIQDIREGGARFLKRSEGGDEWEEVKEDAVYEKISHALRGNGSSRKDFSDSTTATPPSQTPKADVASSSRRKKKPPPKASAASVVSVVDSSPSSAGNGTIDSAPPAANSVLASQSNDQFSSLRNDTLGGNAGTGGLLASLLQGLAQERMASSASASGSTILMENLVAAQLLQNQLARQREQEQIQQLLVSSAAASPSTQLLGLLFANASDSQASQTLNHANLSQLLQGSSTNLGSMLGVSPQPAVNDQLLTLLIAAQQGNGTHASSSASIQPRINLTGAVDQLLQQQQQQSRSQMIRHLEVELALRRLAPVPRSVGGEANSASTGNENALLLAALMGRSLHSGQPSEQPPPPPAQK